MENELGRQLSKAINDVGKDILAMNKLIKSDPGAPAEAVLLMNNLLTNWTKLIIIGLVGAKDKKPQQLDLGETWRGKN